MRRGIFTATGLTLLIALALIPLAAQQGRPWIHVQVNEPGEDGKKVDIHLPLSLAEVALDLAPDDVITDGHLTLKRQDISIADLRRAWNELKASGEVEFVMVEEKDKKVRVAREADLIRVQVEDRANQEKAVQLRLPIVVVDALLSGEGESLDLRAALGQLKGQRGEIVNVEDGGKTVRIWIDEKS